MSADGAERVAGSAHGPPSVPAAGLASEAADPLSGDHGALTPARPADDHGVGSVRCQLGLSTGSAEGRYGVSLRWVWA